MLLLVLLVLFGITAAEDKCSKGCYEVWLYGDNNMEKKVAENCPDPDKQRVPCAPKDCITYFLTGTAQYEGKEVSAEIYHESCNPPENLCDKLEEDMTDGLLKKEQGFKKLECFFLDMAWADNLYDAVDAAENADLDLDFSNVKW